jgi:hypothetical protein
MAIAMYGFVLLFIAPFQSDQDELNSRGCALSLIEAIRHTQPKPK